MLRVVRGTAFWRRDDDGLNRHLRFIISEQNVDNFVLVVGVSTLRGTGREDTSCILEVGDHPSIRVRSYVRYDKAFEIDYLKLLNERMHGQITMVDELPGLAIKRIQEGARKSPALAGKFKKYFVLF